MKRIIVILLCLCLLLVACGNEPVSTESGDIHPDVAPATETTTVAAITEATTELATETTTVREELQSARDTKESTIQFETATYSDAIAAFDDAFIVLEAMVSVLPEDSEEDLAQVLSGAAMQLLEVHAGFMEIADDGSEQNFFAEKVPTVFKYEVEAEFVESYGYNAGYYVYRENNYISIESEAFASETNEQLDYLRFDIASREDETMLLFAWYDIDGLLTSSNRYLLYNNGDSVQLLYSRTFGKTLEYRINLNEWAKGTDYTWSEELLYPAK